MQFQSQTMEMSKALCYEAKLDESKSSTALALLLKLTSWNGMYEHGAHDNRRAVMKATTCGILHLAWIAFMCSGGYFLVRLLPSYYDYMYTAVYLFTVYSLVSMTQPEQTHAGYMGIAFWISGISFAPTRNPILALSANMIYAAFYSHDFLKVVSLLFFIHKIWSTPRILWDTNPCTILYAIVILFVLSTTLVYATFKVIPLHIIPYFVFPFVQFPDQFSDTTTQIIIQTFNSGVFIFLLYIISELYHDTELPHTL